MQPISIVAQTPDFMVISKPSGISTHASPGDTAPNVIDLLKNKFPQLFPVYRLDNGTSGLLLLGLNSDFAKGVEVRSKIYLARVWGIAPVSGAIDQPLTTKQFRTRQNRTQEARSRFRRVKTENDQSCLMVRLETGRHHQIRRHLRTLGFPVIGDFRHGDKKKNLDYQKKSGSQLELQLRCYRLAFAFRGKVFRMKSL